MGDCRQEKKELANGPMHTFYSSHRRLPRWRGVGGGIIKWGKPIKTCPHRDKKK